MTAVIRRALFLVCLPSVFVASAAWSNDQLVIDKIYLGMTRTAVDSVFDHCKLINSSLGTTQIVSCGAGAEQGAVVALDTAAQRVIEVYSWKGVDPKDDLEKIKEQVKENYGNPSLSVEDVNDWRADKGNAWRVCYGDCTDNGPDAGGIDIAPGGKGMVVVLGTYVDKRLKLVFRLQDNGAHERLEQAAYEAFEKEQRAE